MNGEWPKVLLRQCPITGGMPTGMTRSAWNRACAAMRRGKVRIAGGYQLRGGAHQAKTWCDVCGGKVLPRELTLLTDREAEEMAKVVNKIGVCESCGQKAALQTNRGSNLCSTCVNIRSQVANRPEIVARAARDLSKAEEMVRLIVVDEALRVAVDDAESKVLAEVRGIVGYEGEEPEGLVEAVRSVAARAAGSDCQVCAEDVEDILRGCGLNRGEAMWWQSSFERPLAVLAALQSLAHDEDRLVGWVRKANGLESSLVKRNYEVAVWKRSAGNWEADAMNLRDEVARLNEDLAVLKGQTGLEDEDTTRLRDELARTGAEVVELRDKLQAAQADLLWFRVAVDGVKEKLNMGADDDFGQAPEHIASMMQAFGRFQALAQSEASRADFAEQELRQVREQLRADQERIAALRERLESTADALIGRGDDCLSGEVLTSMDNDQVVLADFARRVLRGEVAITFRGVQ